MVELGNKVGTRLGTLGAAGRRSKKARESVRIPGKFVDFDRMEKTAFMTRGFRQIGDSLPCVPSPPLSNS